VTTSRPKETYDPHVNYSGGGWWWHTPYETHDKMDVNILAKDVKIELNLIFRLANCEVIPFNFTSYADRITKILEDMQLKADKINGYFNLHQMIEYSKEFKKLSVELDELAKKIAASEEKDKIEVLNHTFLWVGRYLNPIAHSDGDISEQVNMETFGAQPFPRISRIIDLASMTLHQSSEFKLLLTKLIRERNLVEDGFYQSNELIKSTINQLK